MPPSLSTLDVGIILLCVGGLSLIGFLNRSRIVTAQGHFLARKSASWPRLGFALYASTLGATSLVGLSGSAYAHGIAVFAYEWMAALVLPAFCVFILPIYLRSAMFTVPEFLELRYGRLVRTYVSLLNIGLDIVLSGGGGLFGGAVLFQLLVPQWPLWMVCTVLAVLSAGFLVLGGLKAVILVESIQGVIIVGACACLAWFAFAAAGGVPQALAHIDPARLKLIMPHDDPNMPWIGLVTGVPLIGFYYWCANQTMVQRMMAARSIDHGRWGSLFGGLLKLSTLFVVILPGVVATLLFPNLKMADQVFPHLIFHVLPPGLTGLILAACVVSILSGLASAFNATSTLVTMDFVHRMRPDFDDRRLILVGHVVTVVAMALSILCATQISHFRDTLWGYLQAVMSYFVPPIAAIFFAGLFFRRVNATGAALGLAIGTVAGIVGLFGIEIGQVIPIHFQVAAALIFVITLIAAGLGSLLAPPEDEARIAPLMFSPAVWRAESESLRGVKWFRNYRFLSLGLIAATGAIVFWFR